MTMTSIAVHEWPDHSKSLGSGPEFNHVAGQLIFTIVDLTIHTQITKICYFNILSEQLY